MTMSSQPQAFQCVDLVLALAGVPEDYGGPSCQPQAGLTEEYCFVSIQEYGVRQVVAGLAVFGDRFPLVLGAVPEWLFPRLVWVFVPPLWAVCEWWEVSVGVIGIADAGVQHGVFPRVVGRVPGLGG